MCRAGPSSSRRDRRAIHPADLDELHQAVGKITLKNRALNAECLPRTVSVGSGSSGGSSRLEAKDPNRGQRHPLCPVTGRLSNVSDDYLVSPRVLGEGHYGCVRECTSRSTGRTLACKSIDKSRIARLDHLRREVELLSVVDHPSIMRMVDCYEDAYYLHIVAEKYTGGELFDRIMDNTHDGGCYSERKASRIVRSLLEAVAYLHERDIAHRDLKPENILFESGDRDAVRLIDFGLSRRHGGGDAPMSDPVGTAYYMAPELLEGRYDKSCDVWSVGTIVYILLCGYPPFNGETDPDIFESILSGRLEFPERQWAAKSGEAKDFIKCLLRRDPRKRFSAKEALKHPWIVNEGRKAPRRRRSCIRYLRIP